MKVATLTTAQQTEAAALSSAVKTSQTARKALDTYLRSVATSATKMSRVSLTDDGTSVVIQ
jgi:hypothetical protein